MNMLDGDISIGMFRFEVIVCRNPLLNKPCTVYIEDVNSSSEENVKYYRDSIRWVLCRERTVGVDFANGILYHYKLCT